MAKIKIKIINGPNLNLLGTRETSIYGNQSFEKYLEALSSRYADIVSFEYFQSNIEGEIVTAIQEAISSADGLILNPAAYTHTSIAIGDAVAAVVVPVVEVHISNVFAREVFRKISYVSAKCDGVISGLGLKGYELAVEYLLEKIEIN